MSIALMGWLNAVVGLIIFSAGLGLNYRKDVVQKMAEKKYNAEASAVYAHLAGPLEISFGIGLATEGLSIAEVLPRYMLIPGLAVGGFILLFAFGFWAFYLRRNEK